ncbi:MAG: tetratricopeptide repeat protein [Alphaproteobacteria bacterium]|nr:tetratricopeptide repeat protein [Alphaproteobacteria bacterium]
MKQHFTLFSLCASMGLAVALLGCSNADGERTSQLSARDYMTADLLREQQFDAVSGRYGDYLIARHAEAIADYSTAAEILHRLWRTAPDNGLLGYSAVNNAMLMGRHEMAIEIAGTLRSRAVPPANPNDQNAVAVVLALEHLKAGRYTAAIREAQTAMVDVGIVQYIKPLIIAWAQVGMGDFDKGRRTLEEQMNHSVMRNIFWLNQVYIDIHCGDYTFAARHLKELINSLDNPPDPLIELYAKLLLWSDGEVAAQVYLRTLPPSNKRDLLVKSLREANPPSVSALKLNRAEYGFAEGLNELNKLLRHEAPALGLFYARTATYLEPSNQPALLIIGDILFDLERYDEALFALDKISDPASMVYRDAITLAAETERRMGKTRQAIERIKRAIEQFPEDTDLLFELGQIYQYEEDYKSAIAVYTRAITARPILRPNWSDYYFRGIAYERTDQWPNAEKDFLRALEIDADSPYVLNYLGYSWIDQRKHINRALKMLKRAVALDPDNAFIIDSYGWALYRTEQFEEAAIHLERAVNMEPSEAVINDHLGDVYWHLGRTIEAHYQWQRALTLELESLEVQAEIEEKIVGSRVPQP